MAAAAAAIVWTLHGATRPVAQIAIPGFTVLQEESVMSLSKVIELSSSSPKSVEDAVQSGLRKMAQTVKNIKGAWVNEIKVVTDADGSITEWRVNMRINFIVE